MTPILNFQLHSTTTKEDRMREIAATLTDEIPELSDQDVNAIDGAGDGQYQRHFVSLSASSLTNPLTLSQWKKEFSQ